MILIKNGPAISMEPWNLRLNVGAYPELLLLKPFLNLNLASWTQLPSVPITHNTIQASAVRWQILCGYTCGNWLKWPHPMGNCGWQVLSWGQHTRPATLQEKKKQRTENPTLRGAWITAATAIGIVHFKLFKCIQMRSCQNVIVSSDVTVSKKADVWPVLICSDWSSDIMSQVVPKTPQMMWT